MFTCQTELLCVTKNSHLSNIQQIIEALLLFPGCGKKITFSLEHLKFITDSSFYYQFSRFACFFSKQVSFNSIILGNFYLHKTVNTLFCRSLRDVCCCLILESFLGQSIISSLSSAAVWLLLGGASLTVHSECLTALINGSNVEEHLFT